MFITAQQQLQNFPAQWRGGRIMLSDKKLKLNSEWEQARVPNPSRCQKKKEISEVVSVLYYLSTVPWRRRGGVKV
jgi:hypothetical protein